MPIITVVGGEGYIGSSLIKYLANTFQNKKDIRIQSIDIGWFSNEFHPFIKDSKGKYNVLFKGLNVGTPYDKANGSIEFYRGDILHFINVALNSDVVVWLAGHSSVGMCANNLDNAMTNNVDNFRQFLTPYMRMGNKPLVLYASSSSVYGHANAICKETDVIGYPGVGDYDSTMIAREMMVDIELQKWKKLGNPDYFEIPKIIGFRFGTVVGDSPNMRTELMNNNMVRTALTNQEIIVAHPDTKRAILTTNTLNFTFTTIISRYLDGFSIPENGIYNLATLPATTVGALAEGVRDYIGNNIKIKVDNTYPPSKYSFHLSREKLFAYEYLQRIDTLHSTVNRPIYQAYHGGGVDDNVLKYNLIHFGTRNEVMKYEQPKFD